MSQPSAEIARQYLLEFLREWMAGMKLKLIHSEIHRLKDAFPDRGEP